ncbi:uncharacterized protein LOC6579982 [Drosophila mojavensis]|uniref:Protein DP71L n=1 Tax=Drosophila mojavensis TaxID=7230 RepID=B4KLY0_DROMO|nr:uncharacterized protein LOC6579982 [Drosophila mojavensis]EDW09790.2 uncharacterized protein Dmoj_GI20700 [Drosophila mojavensis]
MLHILQMIVAMSSPIHKQYCFASPRRTKTTSESDKGLLNNSEERNANILLDDLPPQPLAAAMFSFQLMADAVNRALQHCTTSPPKNSTMTQIEFNSSSAPSFCYFFIDMQPQSENDYNFSDYNMNSYQNYTNPSDKQQPSSCHQTSEANDSKFQRQRSLSECSDDSFICFEDDNKSIDSIAFGCTDCNGTDKMSEIDNSQEHRKRVRFDLKPKVHVMHTWDYAYRAARKGGWQQIALDRERFQQRINRIAPTLNIILTSNHRDKIYKDRFLVIK